MKRVNAEEIGHAMLIDDGDQSLDVAGVGLLKPDLLLDGEEAVVPR